MWAWTNLSLQDVTWAEFSTLEDTACKVCIYMQHLPIQPNLESKTRPKQLLGSLPLDIALPGVGEIPLYFQSPSVQQNMAQKLLNRCYNIGTENILCVDWLNLLHSEFRAMPCLVCWQNYEFSQLLNLIKPPRKSLGILLRINLKEFKFWVNFSTKIQ